MLHHLKDRVGHEDSISHMDHEERGLHSTREDQQPFEPHLCTFHFHPPSQYEYRTDIASSLIDAGSKYAQQIVPSNTFRGALLFLEVLLSNKGLAFPVLYHRCKTAVKKFWKAASSKHSFFE